MPTDNDRPMSPEDWLIARHKQEHPDCNGAISADFEMLEAYAKYVGDLREKWALERAAGEIDDHRLENAFDSHRCDECNAFRWAADHCRALIGDK